MRKLSARRALVSEIADEDSDKDSDEECEEVAERVMPDGMLFRCEQGAQNAEVDALSRREGRDESDQLVGPAPVFVALPLVSSERYMSGSGSSWLRRSVTSATLCRPGVCCRVGWTS